MKMRRKERNEKDYETQISLKNYSLEIKIENVIRLLKHTQANLHALNGTEVNFREHEYRIMAQSIHFCKDMINYMETMVEVYRNYNIPVEYYRNCKQQILYKLLDQKRFGHHSPKAQRILQNLKTGEIAKNRILEYLIQHENNKKAKKTKKV